MRLPLAFFTFTFTIALAATPAFADPAIGKRTAVGPGISGIDHSFAVKSRKAVGPGISGIDHSFAVKSRKAVDPDAHHAKHQLSQLNTAKPALDLNAGL